MGGLIKVRVVEARNLPVMDRATGLTDAYVEFKFGSHTTDRTPICRLTLNPIWNHTFRIDVPDDSELQDFPVQLRVWDKDTYSSDDLVGNVTIDLNCLLPEDSPDHIDGWFPIFDTLRGIQGYLHCIVALQFFGDINPFTDSAAGVMIFASQPGVGDSSSPLKVSVIEGFVEELFIVNDPEYQWLDSFRASRTSNEERQLLFHTLSNRIRRAVGRKALDMGGNAVLGYQHHIDMESENGALVARGYGTACVVSNITPPSSRSNSPSRSRESLGVDLGDAYRNPGKTYSILNAPPSRHGIHLLSISSLPEGIRYRIGGMVAARSVKVLTYKQCLQEVRDAWWNEIREEIRTHTKTLNCTVVLGYNEVTTISGDVCVLSAYGTAVRVNKRHLHRGKLSVERRRHSIDSTMEEEPVFKVPAEEKPCSMCHLPYNRKSSPFRMHLNPCRVCKRANKYVPELLLASIDPPKSLGIACEGEMVQARIFREMKGVGGEAQAKALSKELPFLEFHVHQQLVHKLRILGLNAAFSVQLSLSIGEDTVIAIATATGVFLPCLPSPGLLKILRNIEVMDAEDVLLLRLQQRLMKLCEENHDRVQEHLEVWLATREMMLTYHTRESEDSVTIEGKLNDARDALDSDSSWSCDASSNSSLSDQDDDPDDTIVLEIDDETDESVMGQLLDFRPPPGFVVLNTQRPLMDSTTLGQSGSLVTILKRTKCDWKKDSEFREVFDDIMCELCYKARSRMPCVILGISTEVSMPSDDELEILLTAMIVETAPSVAAKAVTSQPQLMPRNTTVTDTSRFITRETELTGHDDLPEFLKDPFHFQHVVLTSLNSLPGHRILRHLGSIQLMLIRETGSGPRDRESGLSEFSQLFINESLALLRSHVVSRGGNALIGYEMKPPFIEESKNNRYAILIVSGDAVLLTPE